MVVPVNVKYWALLAVIGTLLNTATTNMTRERRSANALVTVVYCAGCGYRPKYEELRNQLENVFGDSISIEGTGTPGITGYFEVTVAGVLVHSKKNGDGYVDSAVKLDKITAAVSVALGPK